MGTILLFVAQPLWTFVTAHASAAPPTDSANFLVGNSFQQALSAPLSATWEHVDLRTIGRRIEGTRGVALLLDRRIDPSREWNVAATGESLREFLEQVARDAGGRARVVGNSIYFGPIPATDKLRTLIALRQQELHVEGAAIPRPRRFALSQPETFSWSEPGQPAEILERLAESRDLKIDGREQVPYDLWAAGTLPQATAVEALSLLLIQWDLTWKWTDGGRRIRLVPIPERVVIERDHLPPRGIKALAALEQWQKELPGLEGRVSAGEVVVQATLEQHEAIEKSKRPPTKEKGGPKLKPLKQERYTLRIKDTPARSLMKKLEEPAYGQLVFEYDAEALREAKIDLDRRITIEVRMATIEQLLKSTFEPLGLMFEIEDRTVHLRISRPD